MDFLSPFWKREALSNEDVALESRHCPAKSALSMADIVDIHGNLRACRARKEMREKAFTLIEVILVVTILGILAAVVLPSFQDHATSARESATKSNLMTIRSQIELYKLEHNEIPPGYAAGMPVTVDVMQIQLTGTTTVDGAASPSTIPATPFLYGPYLKKIPRNPFNNLSTIAYVAEATAFSAAVDGTSSGWLYKKETGEFVVNWTGTDREGVAFYNY
ncbi:MAG: prepilin-type N-terminal cleavage/methylation domain-containing protein [Planctomycetota bacterium]|jgi:prepilin-type N-terminal cleavage/methylation domain-containing protein